MNFFEHQELARRRTRTLVVLFLLGVLGVVITIHIALATLWAVREVRGESGAIDWSALTNPAIAAGSAALAISIIAIGSFIKIAELRGGGRAIAERVGGRLISPATTDNNERKICNIVEEMSIASGVPTPPVYLLADEPGINAFAAGFAPESAVVAVSRGCIERLTRDELQGVVAHEFSHILNGDMRLNIRLIGMVHGLVAIGLSGYLLLRIMMHSGHGRRSSSSKGDPRIFLLLLGVALIVIGFVGSFFGELIKAAVSRQREFLADASAVQFTRNPDGIAGALKKIGGLSTHGHLKSNAVPEMRHMFFASAIDSGLAGLLATHPPLPERIRAIDPNWDGKYLGSIPARQDDRAAERETHAQRLGKLGRIFTAAGAAAMMSEPNPNDLDAAVSLIAEIPGPLLDAARNPSAARAVVFAILLDTTPGSNRDLQTQTLRMTVPPDVLAQIKPLLPLAQGLPRRLLLPILDLSMAALAELSPEQYRAFRNQVGRMVYADERVDLLEWVLQRVLMRSLDLRFGIEKPAPAGRLRLRLINKDAGLALSMLAHAGRDDQLGARQAFTEAARAIRGVELRFLPPTECGLTRLDKALQRLTDLVPADKQIFIEACAACIHADRTITENEAELFRALAVTLGVPVPPITPG
jgi:Zn-dependent protease with chaperone function